VVITRGRSATNGSKLSQLEADGAKVMVSALHDVDSLVGCFEEVQVAICLLHGTAAVIEVIGPLVLQAVIKAGTVRRLVLDEFGCDTMSMPAGRGRLFDAKKSMQALVRENASDLEFSCVFPGLIFDYSLPNLREYDRITTYGDLSCRYPVHHCDDIGRITVLTALDPRCAGKGVQIDANWCSQGEWEGLLKKHWPDATFEFADHVSCDTVLELAETGDTELPEECPERERMAINRACYVWAEVCAKEENRDKDVLLATDLFPEVVYSTVDQALALREFVFGH